MDEEVLGTWVLIFGKTGRAAGAMCEGRLVDGMSTGEIGRYYIKRGGDVER